MDGHLRTLGTDEHLVEERSSRQRQSDVSLLTINCELLVDLRAVLRLVIGGRTIIPKA